MFQPIAGSPRRAASRSSTGPCRAMPTRFLNRSSVPERNPVREGIHAAATIRSRQKLPAAILQSCRRQGIVTRRVVCLHRSKDTRRRAPDFLLKKLGDPNIALGHDCCGRCPDPLALRRLTSRELSQPSWLHGGAQWFVAYRRGSGRLVHHIDRLAVSSAQWCSSRSPGSLSRWSRSLKHQ
jgi:hypothetical protein